jgi:ABC-type glycerol-3-phosphate transport system substrate-binding protein
VKYASPDIIKVYKKFISYIDKGYFGKGFMGNTYQQCEEIFATGKAAMFPMGNWFIGDLAQLKPSFETGWFTYPTESGKPFYVKGLGCSFSVSAQTKSPKEVLAFYKWLATSAESVALQSERMSLIPDVKEKVSYKADPLLLEIQKKISGLDSAIWAYTQWGDNAPPPGAYDFCVKISQDVAAGADIEKSLKSLDEEFDKLLKSR